MEGPQLRREGDQRHPLVDRESGNGRQQIALADHGGADQADPQDDHR